MHGSTAYEEIRIPIARHIGKTAIKREINSKEIRPNPRCRWRSPRISAPSALEVEEFSVPLPPQTAPSSPSTLPLQQMVLSLRTMCPCWNPTSASEKIQGHKRRLSARLHTKSAPLHLHIHAPTRGRRLLTTLGREERRDISVGATAENWTPCGHV